MPIKVSFTSKTMIGNELSIQNVIAVESMTCRPRARTSKRLSFSTLTGGGSRRGAARYTPTARAGALCHTPTAPTPAARRAAGGSAATPAVRA